MGSDYRKLLEKLRRDVEDCIKKCEEKCPRKCAETAPSNLGPPVITNGFLITGCMLGGVFFLCLVFMVVRRYVLQRRNRLRERSLPILFDTQQDFVDEDHGPVLDHPIWYINTVGLAQSVIDSITVCKYKRGDGLIEGTECSVCLSEFDEDESVRLLPKCSHAFHVSCIDTWLRSHKNCPLCRAPIVRENAGASASFRVSVSEPNSSDSGLTEDTQMQNSENLGVTEGRQVEEGETSEVRIEDGRIHDSMIKNMSTSVVRSSGSRVLSDLGDNRERVGEETQVMRRSVSMDASSAEAIYRAVASVVSNQGISNSQLAVPVKGSNLVVLSKRASSIGISLQKGPTSLKRSLSSSRRFFTSKHRRSQSSILPS